MTRARIADIIHHASQLSGVSVASIQTASRKREVVRVRQAIMLIAREQRRKDGDLVTFAYSFKQIGSALGGKDHSTIMHGCDKAALIAERDPVYAGFIDALREASANGAIFAGEVKVATPSVRSRRVSSAPVPVPVPEPIPEKQWEVIELGGEHRLVMDEDGMTPGDYRTAAKLKAGSSDLAAAMMAEAR
jgi:hypothetical protein